MIFYHRKGEKRVRRNREQAEKALGKKAKVEGKK